MDIEQTVNKTIYDVLRKHGVTMDMITPEKSIIDDLRAESLDVIEMMLAFEEIFDTSIEEGNVRNISTVGDIYSHIREYYVEA